MENKSIKRIFKLVILIFLFLNLRNTLQAQCIQKFVDEQGYYATLEQGKNWSDIDIRTTAKHYVFKPIFTMTLVQVFIRNNNATTANNYSFTVNESSDPNAIINGPCGLTQGFTTSNLTTFGAGCGGINAQQLVTCSFWSSNAAAVSINFQNTGGLAVGTFDLFINFSNGSGGANLGMAVDNFAGSYVPLKVQGNGGSGLVVAIGGTGIDTNTGTNPCVSPMPGLIGGNIQSKVIHITTATTTQLVSAQVLQKIHPCEFSLTISGTGTQTVKFVFGTGANCGTGTTDITGTWTTSATTGFLVTGGRMTPIASNTALCITTTGTTVVVDGVISYFQNVTIV